MSDNWLEIPGEGVNVQEIMRQIRQRIAAREGSVSRGSTEEPAGIVEALWEEMIGDQTGLTLFPLGQRECDIVPREYVIDWRVPILGPIHAIVRRLINAEIRRYLFSSLERQSSFNRKVRRLLKDLVQENDRLRQEVEEIQQRLEQDC